MKPITCSAVTLLTLLASSVHAGLGDGGSGPLADASALRATDSVSGNGLYVRHELLTPTGDLIHEYVNAAGVTFAITWSGIVQPNLSVLLGSHYTDYLAETGQSSSQHHQVIVHSTLLHIEVRKLPRGFMGAAQLRAAIPVGVLAGDLR
jgi:hypothetical protein